MTKALQRAFPGVWRYASQSCRNCWEVIGTDYEQSPNQRSSEPPILSIRAQSGGDERRSVSFRVRKSMSLSLIGGIWDDHSSRLVLQQRSWQA